MSNHVRPFSAQSTPTRNGASRAWVGFLCPMLLLIAFGCGQQPVSTMQAWDDPVATSAKLMTDERRESADGDSRSTVPVALVSPTATSWKPRGPVRDWQSIVIHHTATESGSVESIHRVHQQRTDAAGNPWRGIGYHFVIGNGQGMEDGAVEPTFRWRGQLEGAHAGVSRYNEQGVGVCLVGDFDQHPPTKAQLASLKLLIAWLTQEYGISFSQVKGHGQLKATACPGKFFPMEEVTDHYLKNTSHRINTLASHSTL